MKKILNKPISFCNISDANKQTYKYLINFEKENSIKHMKLAPFDRDCCVSLGHHLHTDLSQIIWRGCGGQANEF